MDVGMTLPVMEPDLWAADDTLEVWARAIDRPIARLYPACVTCEYPCRATHRAGRVGTRSTSRHPRSSAGRRNPTYRKAGKANSSAGRTHGSMA